MMHDDLTLAQDLQVCFHQSSNTVCRWQVSAGSIGLLSVHYASNSLVFSFQICRLWLNTTSSNARQLTSDLVSSFKEYNSAVPGIKPRVNLCWPALADVKHVPRQYHFRLFLCMFRCGQDPIYTTVKHWKAKPGPVVMLVDCTSNYGPADTIFHSSTLDVSIHQLCSKGARHAREKGNAMAE